IAHPPQIETDGFDERGGEWIDRTRVGLQRCGEVDVAASEKDGDAVIADAPGDENPIPGPYGSGGQRRARIHTTDTRRCDVEAVSSSGLDGLGAAAHDSNTRALGGGAHGRNFRFEDLRRRAGFDDQAAEQREWYGAPDREIVDRTVDGEIADRAARKTQR